MDRVATTLPPDCRTTSDQGTAVSRSAGWGQENTGVDRYSTAQSRGSSRRAFHEPESMKSGYSLGVQPAA